MSEHAYNHMEQTHLFLCPICDIGAQSRETVQKHIKEFHPSAPEKAVDNRLKHAQEIKVDRKFFFIWNTRILFPMII